MEAQEKGTDCMTLFKGSRLGKPLYKEVPEMKPKMRGESWSDKSGRGYSREKDQCEQEHTIRRE